MAGSLVQSWITSPASNFGVELKGSGGANLTLDSKENTTTSYPAVLEIALSGPNGPVRPAGAKGPTGATGPQGPAESLVLPYAVEGNGNGLGNYVFEIVAGGDKGSGGIYGQGRSANPTELLRAAPGSLAWAALRWILPKSPQESAFSAWEVRGWGLETMRELVARSKVAASSRASEPMAL